MPGGRILVVDDDRMVRDTIGRCLRDEGYEVEYSPDGSDAVEKVSLHLPDAILLDLMMPGMNGRQFMIALREEMGLTKIPVLVMTAIHGISPQQAHALGANDVIEKPFKVDEVLNKVALALFRAQYALLEDSNVARTEVTGQEQDHDEWTGPEPDEHSGGIVLVVDPDRSTWRRLDSMLGQRGFTVVSMARVTDDLPRLARVLEPHAILLEFNLPDADCLNVLGRLRSEPALDPVPILLICSDHDALAKARPDIQALDAAILPKPIVDEALLKFLPV